MGRRITVIDRQKGLPLNPARVRRIVRRILELEGRREADLTFVFVTDGEIRRLNRRFLGRNHPTDVLAFDTGDPCGRKVEGDVVISVPTARRQAGEYGTTPGRELRLYMVHGILHLLGYDDHGVAATRRMRARERDLTAVLDEEALMPVEDGARRPTTKRRRRR